MASYINKMTLPDGSTDVNIADFRNAGVYYGTCATGASTAAKAVTVTDARGDSHFELTTGVIVFVKFTNEITVGNSTLNVNDTGAYRIYFQNIYNQGFMTLTKGDVYGFIYDGSYYRLISSPLLATKMHPPRNNAVMNGVLYRYQVIFTQRDGKLMAANTTSNDTGTSKTMSSNAFDPCKPIYYYAATSTVNSGAAPGAALIHNVYDTVDLRYSFNSSTTTFVANDPVYIRCTPQADGTVKFYNTTANCIVKTLPNTADGDVYIYLGKAYDTSKITLDLYHPIYEYKNGRIGLWSNTSDLPSVSSSDNGKVLRVVNGAWSAVELPSASGVSF